MFAIYFQCLVVIPIESYCVFCDSFFYQVYLYNLVTQALPWHHNGFYVLQNNQVIWESGVTAKALNTVSIP